MLYYCNKLNERKFILTISNGKLCKYPLDFILFDGHIKLQNGLHGLIKLTIKLWSFEVVYKELLRMHNYFMCPP